MIQHLLIEYGISVALVTLVVSSVFLFRARYIASSLLIGVSALAMLILDVMHKITFSQKLVEYSHDHQGNVLGANIEFTFWQSTALWVNPIGIILISVGLLIVSKQLVALNKALKNDADKAGAF